jgi:hypothetical protein
MRSCSLESISDLTAGPQNHRTARQKAMSDKEKDKRLLLPRDEFEEEASEGLGKLNREEASEDLQELQVRMQRRVRKPGMIWLPAAAAVVILLVASAVYFAIFKERKVPGTDMATAETPITDTALIAMAEPIKKTETKSAENTRTPGAKGSARATMSAPAKTEEVRSAQAELDVAGVNKVEANAAKEVTEGEELAEVVTVEAIPVMEKAAAYEKKDKAAAAKTIEDSAAATPNLGVGMPNRQAEPVGGMKEFNRWIQSNIRYPEEVVPRVRQVIVVTFKIAADSTLYDLKAEQTAGDTFAKEAFRLLREGPKWEPVVREGRVVPEEVRVSIVFR